MRSSYPPEQTQQTTAQIIIFKKEIYEREISATWWLRGCFEFVVLLREEGGFG